MSMPAPLRGSAADLHDQPMPVAPSGVPSKPMKSFLAACVAIVLIAITGAVVLNLVVQEPVATAFATSAVRL
jgi:hypothetical protein